MMRRRNAIEMHHVTVYRATGRYAGWPANYGIWSWGDEIVTGFTLGYHDNGGGFHARDTGRPFVAMQVRSRVVGQFDSERLDKYSTSDRTPLSAFVSNIIKRK